MPNCCSTDVGTSLIITLLTLVCSYPIALYVHRSSGLWRSVLLVLVSRRC